MDEEVDLATEKIVGDRVLPEKMTMEKVEELQMWCGEEEDGGWPEMEMDVEGKMEMMAVRQSGGGGGLRTAALR